MINNNQNGFFTPYKISKSSKIFLALFLTIALAVFGYLLFKAGEKLEDIIELLAGVIGGIILILWLVLESIKIRNGESLSKEERLCIDDLGRYKFTQVVKKYIFSDMELDDILRFIVAVGYIIKWMLFDIFAVSTVVVFYTNDILFNKIFFLSLGVAWCPWIENIILKKLNFKVVFIIRLLVTILAGIIITNRGG